MLRLGYLCLPEVEFPSYLTIPDLSLVLVRTVYSKRGGNAALYPMCSPTLLSLFEVRLKTMSLVLVTSE